VHTVDLIDPEAIHQTVLDHRRRTRAALFRRLKDHHGIAGEIPGLGEIARRAQQHRGVPIMAAGVHLARHGGAIGYAGLFLDRQGVHVGAQADRLDVAAIAALAALDDADHAGAPETGGDLVTAECPQMVCNEGRCAMHVVHQFGIGMQVAAPAHDLGLQVGDAVDDGHGETSRKYITTRS
jgi:hypothetical protein